MRQTMTALILAAVTALPLALAGTASAQEQSRPALTDMSEADRENLRIEIRAYLLENPEVLFEAIQILEARRDAQKRGADADLIAANGDAIFNDGYSWVGGNPDGDVTLVEFLDYRCGYCKKAHPEVKALLESDPNIRLVVKEFPILGPESVAAGRMALAALRVDPSRFGELNDALMTFQGSLTEATAYQIAANAGYDIAALKQEAAGEVVGAMVNANYALARDLGLEGTPSFVVGKQIVRGYIPLEQMQAAVAQARAAAN